MELDDFKPTYILNVYEHEAIIICSWVGLLASWRPQNATERFWSIDTDTVVLQLYGKLTDQQKMRLKLYLGFDIEE